MSQFRKIIFTDVHVQDNGLGGDRLERFQEILSSYRYKSSTKRPNEKVLGKSVPMVKKQKSKTSYMRRVIKILWKNRMNDKGEFEFMGNTIGKHMIISLNGRKDYPLEELKSLALKEFVTEKNKFFFQNSIVQLKLEDSSFIIEYKNEYGDECGSWEFTKQYKKEGHSLHLYLYTTFIGNINEIKAKSNEPTTSNVFDFSDSVNTDVEVFPKYRSQKSEYTSTLIMGKKQALKKAYILIPMSYPKLTLKHLQTAHREV
ncbi:uncharacterized protein LOC127287544 [Leptopilina boulardi]|uniref:uncharacterized protein LOC127287544 n=1 Tax=Leptopilina boulardi TaxID=63433 RepID=UPI0021F5DE27|nr:uncharacterized protein LOC127287544 [Leptopilina boulardi]